MNANQENYKGDYRISLKEPPPKRFNRLVRVLMTVVLSLMAWPVLPATIAKAVNYGPPPSSITGTMTVINKTLQPNGDSWFYMEINSINGLDQTGSAGTASLWNYDGADFIMCIDPGLTEPYIGQSGVSTVYWISSDGDWYGCTTIRAGAALLRGSSDGQGT
jgi:hypothetical protein